MQFLGPSGHPAAFPRSIYYISSELMEPRGAPPHYTERLVCLPNLYDLLLNRLLSAARIAQPNKPRIKLHSRRPPRSGQITL